MGCGRGGSFGKERGRFSYGRLRWMRARSVRGTCQWHRLNKISGGCEGIGGVDLGYIE